MAEALLKRRLAGASLPEPVQVASAGTCASKGAPASDEALTVLLERGIDGRAHRASQLTRELIDAADLILTMKPEHKAHVLSLQPQAVPRVFSLWEFAAGEDARGVSDPFGQSLEVYRATRDELEELIAKTAGRLPEFFGWNREGGQHA